MKVVLSRKGFDSAAGGGDSPILPDGRLVSLPIPSADARRYDEVIAGNASMAHLIESLFGPARLDRIGRYCHLDPDLDRGALARRRGWRGVLGQVGAAATHLTNQQVGSGDLFLFFGRFRRTEYRDGRLRFCRDCRPAHVIFGYLQVGQVLRPAAGDPLPAWLEGHPHLEPRYRSHSENTLYLAARRLDFEPSLPGSATFRYAPALQLTRPDAALCRWQLPASVFAGVSISYHSAASWRADGFRAAARGQEFVADATDAVARWARQIVRNGIVAR